MPPEEKSSEATADDGDPVHMLDFLNKAWGERQSAKRSGFGAAIRGLGTGQMIQGHRVMVEVDGMK